MHLPAVTDWDAPLSSLQDDDGNWSVVEVPFMEEVKPDHIRCHRCRRTLHGLLTATDHAFAHLEADERTG